MTLMTILICFTSPAIASLLCQQVLKGKATHEVNQKMVEKYPDLEFLLKDPVSFKEEMQRRFKEQKKLDPENPHRFDFSEIGLTELRIVRKMIPEEIAELKQRLIAIETRQNTKSVSNQLKGLVLRDQQKKMELEIGLKFLDALLKETNFHLKKGKIDYLSFNEIAYFYARATGWFDRDSMRWRDRFMLIFEAKIQGYKKFPIQQEYEFYLNRDFKLSRSKSLWKENQRAMDLFKKDFWKKEELDFIMIPSHAHLGPDIFHRLMAYDVHIVGITRSPIGADGFLRPGGLFWIHDAVHSALIHITKKDYMETKQINQKEFEKMRPQIDQWFLELDKESKAIEDKTFRRVTRRLIFNMHHDRGYPLVPSVILNLPKLPGNAYALYFLLENYGHGVTMPPNTKRLLPKSYEWIQNFWKAREAQEQELLEYVRSNPIATERKESQNVQASPRP